MRSVALVVQSSLGLCWHECFYGLCDPAGFFFSCSKTYQCQMRFVLIGSTLVSVFHGRRLHRAHSADRFGPSVGEVDDSRSRTKILLKIDNLGIARILVDFPKLRDDLDFRAAKSVD